MSYANLRIAASTLAVSYALVATAAHAGGTAAGSLIENTASATYTNGAGEQTVQSNTVSVKVDELLDVTIVSLDSGNVAAGSGTSVLTFKLTNTGNGPEAFDLTADPDQAGNDFLPVVSAIAYDSDGDGVYTAGVDTIIVPGASTPSIAPDTPLTIFVIATSPATATNGQTATINLLAKAATGTGATGTVFAGQGENGSDAVVGVSNADADSTGTLVVEKAAVALAKSAVVSGPYGTEAVPGATVTYTLTATVSGTGSVSGLRIADIIPAGTSYSLGSLKLGATTLTDADDTDAGKASAAGVDVNIGTAASGSTHTVTFSVTINK